MLAIREAMGPSEFITLVSSFKWARRSPDELARDTRPHGQYAGYLCVSAEERILHQMRHSVPFQPCLVKDQWGSGSAALLIINLRVNEATIMMTVLRDGDPPSSRCLPQICIKPGIEIQAKQRRWQRCDSQKDLSQQNRRTERWNGPPHIRDCFTRDDETVRQNNHIPKSSVWPLLCGIQIDLLLRG